ncbi:MAG: ferrous iron transport protein A [Candidatus Omnitrophica bacterium]|nr:ferrous iron transport protein A [Candidatus Omnitrophota bacterium]
MKKALDQLNKGQSGVILSIKGRGAVHRRLLDMGLVKNNTVKVERAAPLGDPIEIRIKGYCLSLRKEEAKNILVDVQ